MATYEVEVKGTVIEFYSVKADSEEEALQRWYEGEMVTQDTYDYEPVAVTLDTFDDDEIDDDDPYEIDPMHVVSWD